MDALWAAVQATLKAELGPENYEIWIKPARLGEVGPDSVQLIWPNRYYRDWVAGNYGAAITRAVNAALDRSVKVDLAVAGAAPPKPAPSAAPPAGADQPFGGQAPTADAPPPSTQPPSTPALLRPEHVSDRPTPTPVEPVAQGIYRDKDFTNFIVGSCNQFAHAAAQAVAESPGDTQYNPLFIYGGTGLGKTHLLHAIGNRVLAADPGARILYMTGEQFTNELISALRWKHMHDFRDKYRRYPQVLLLDDVQFISGKERTQEELFHTFEWLKDRRRQIVFTSDVLPREIRGFEPRLRTRCESGMIADMQPPDIETLVAILHQKGADIGMEVSPELAQFIGVRVRVSIREIEGVLNRLQALCRMHGKQVPDVAFARQHLGSMLPAAPRSPGADEIIKTVASFYNIKVSDLLGERRLKALVRPRHAAMWLVRKHTELSFPEMGRVFHRDHATVQHGVRKIETQVKRDADLENTIQAIERNLGI
jgi:chromosomal replication initiator protein